MGGIAASPVHAEMSIEEKVDLDAREGLKKASEARDIAARDAVLKEKESIKATVELKKRAEKEIETKVAAERMDAINARDRAKAEAQAKEKEAVVIEREALKATVELKKKAEKEIEEQVKAEVLKASEAKQAALKEADDKQNATIKQILADKQAALKNM